MATIHIFDDTDAAALSQSGDSNPVNVYTAFYAFVASGYRATGVRFYVPAGTTGLPSSGYSAYIKTGSSGATALASATFDDPILAGQWNEATLASPIDLTPGQIYYAGVFFPGGLYGFTAAKLLTAINADGTPIYAAGNGEASPGNGSFKYGTAGLPPDSASSGPWYGVEPITDDGTSSPTGPDIADTVGVTDVLSATRTGLPTTVIATGTATDPVGAAVTDAASLAVGEDTSVRFVQRTLLENRIAWGSVVDEGAAGAEKQGPTLAINDLGAPITLSVRFKVQWNCRILGGRIYKHPQLAGIIPISIWDEAGTLLKTVSVSMTADGGGWREIEFGTPASLVPDVLYTFGYYSPNAFFVHTPWVWNAQDICVPPFVIRPFSLGNYGAAYLNGNNFPTTPVASNYYIDPRVEWEDDRPGYDGGMEYWRQWVNGPDPDDDTTIPLGVFSPRSSDIPEYKSIGLTCIHAKGGDVETARYIKEADIDLYMAAGGQQDPTHIGIGNMLNDPEFASHVKGYFIVDEPDLLHPYSPPAMVRDWANTVRVRDSTRPIYLTLGKDVGQNGTFYQQPQGSTMAESNALWRGWADIADMIDGDFYVLSPDHSEERYGVWTYASFARRLHEFNDGRVPVWFDVESTSQTEGFPTPAEFRQACWAGLIAGGRGICFFDTRLPDTNGPFDWAHGLHNPTFKTAWAATNAEIISLARAINAPEANLVSSVISSNTTSGPVGGEFGVPILHTSRVVDDTTYLLTMGIRPGATTATFTIPDAAGKTVTVINEDRILSPVGSGVFVDDYAADYQTHFYSWDT